jgi:hypothetical protein
MTDCIRRELCRTSGRIAEAAQGWTLTGWIVVTVWAVALAAAAGYAYQRDTRRD